LYIYYRSVILPLPPTEHEYCSILGSVTST
jgi:hypothetical protein